MWGGGGGSRALTSGFVSPGLYVPSCSGFRDSGMTRGYRLLSFFQALCSWGTSKVRGLESRDRIPALLVAAKPLLSALRY